MTDSEKDKDRKLKRMSTEAVCTRLQVTGREGQFQDGRETAFAALERSDE